MLKKLVKYGNSNALILDRAILELLNISEGAVVKLHTDGKSLVITPQASAETKDVWMEGMERLELLKNSRIAQMEKQAQPTTENSFDLAQATKNIMQKYEKDLAILTEEPFLQELNTLNEKYKDTIPAPESYQQEYHALRLKHSPNLANFDKEMQEAQLEQYKTDPIKYQQMKEWGPGSENGAKLSAAFQAVFKKYKDDMAIMSSEAFLQDVDALAAKYRNDKTSPAFEKEFFALRLKYAPNLADMDKEIAEVPKQCGMPEYK